MKGHSLFGVIQLICFVIRTKLLWRQARIIRFPFHLRGGRYVKVGKGFTTGFNCRFDALPASKDTKYCIEIGDNFQMNDYVHIAAAGLVKIGDNVLLASKVFITDLNHGCYGENDKHDSPDIPPTKRALAHNDVIIESNVWIGDNVAVLKGVTIGYGSIIGTNSVVTHSIPSYSIAVGTPARVIKKYNKETQKWEKI